MILSGYQLGIYLMNSAVKGFNINREAVVKMRYPVEIEEFQLNKHVHSASRHNNFFVKAPIVNKNAPQIFFIKQIKHFSVDNLFLFDNEMLVNEKLSEIAGLQHVIPRLIATDRIMKLLIFEYLEDFEPMESEGREVDLSPLIKPLYDITTRIHNVKQDLFEGKLHNRKPFFFALSEGELIALKETMTLSYLQLAVLEKLCQPVFFEARRYFGWSETHFIHFDIKPKNVLYKDSEIKIIDWEMAGWGDPYWDKAGLFWIVLNNILVDDDDPAPLFDRAKSDFEGYCEGTVDDKLVFVITVMIIEKIYFGKFPLNDVSAHNWATFLIHNLSDHAK